jgi:uncharacterized cupin superfamily protein
LQQQQQQQQQQSLHLQVWMICCCSAARVCRFVFVVEGKVQVKHDGKAIDLVANDYAYFPPGSNDT